VQKQFSIAEAKNRLPTIVHYVEKGPSVELTHRDGENRLQYCCRSKNMDDLAANIQGFGVLFRNSGARLRMKGLRSPIGILRGFGTWLPSQPMQWMSRKVPRRLHPQLLS